MVSTCSLHPKAVSEIDSRMISFEGKWALPVAHSLELAVTHTHTHTHTHTYSHTHTHTRLRR